MAIAKPNFVIRFTDDQGYADVGCFGAKGFSTPNIDRTAAVILKHLRETAFREKAEHYAKLAARLYKENGGNVLALLALW